MAKSETAICEYTQDDRSYTAAIEEQHGSYSIWILGEKIPVILASVPGKGRNAPKLNPDNHRFDRPVKGASKSVAGQKAIRDHLNSSAATNRLAEALEATGGLNEPLYLLNNIFAEGNRRAAQRLGKDDTLLVVIFPDDLTSEQLDAFLATKHLVGPEEWPSFVQSRQAWTFKHVHGWDDEDIRIACQFATSHATKKYIAAYVWYREFARITRIDDISQWSKFHHALTPTLTSHFGYNAQTEKFDDPKILDKSKTRKKSDALLGIPTDFKWFCNLIKEGRLTDCRESDGIVGPAVRAAGDDEEYAERILQLLNSAPVPSTVIKPGTPNSRNGNRRKRIGETPSVVQDLKRKYVAKKETKLHMRLERLYPPGIRKRHFLTR